MTKPKPLECLGQLHNVQAKTVNKDTVIEIKARLRFNAIAFQKLGKLLNESVYITVDPTQQDAFPEAQSEGEE